ncbi:MAG: hypothetical protein R2791_05280 [Saprospiraceae bacterium]
MENIDDFMRQKFESDPASPGNRFEFREEYWEQASALLEAEEARRRRRRRWLFWWLFTGLLAGIGGWALMHWNSSHAADQGRNAGAPAMHNERKTGPSHSEGNSTIQGDRPMDSGITLSGEAVPEKNERTAKGLDAASGKPLQQQSAAHGEKDILKKGGVQANQPATPALPPKTPDPTGQPLSGNVQTPASSEKPAVPTGTGSPNAAQEVTGTPENRDMTTADPESPLSAERPAACKLLPTFLHPVLLPVRVAVMSRYPTQAQMIKPVRDGRFSLRAEAAAAFMQASPDGERLGAGAGIALQYRLHRNWSLSAGANWRFVPGDWGDPADPKVSEQLHYSFGFVEDTWILERTGLHSLEFPLAIQWSRKTLAVEAGVAPSLLLTVQGRLTNTHFESLQDEPSTKTSRISLDKALYRSLYTSGFAGLEWRATQHLGLGIRGYYRPGSLLKTSDQTASGSQWWFDLGLRWHFKPFK